MAPIVTDPRLFWNANSYMVTVYRGCSWYSVARDCRCAFRGPDVVTGGKNSWNFAARGSDVGLRLVRPEQAR